MTDHRALQMSGQEFAAWNEQMAKQYDPDLYHRSSSGIVRWVEGCRVARIIKSLGANNTHRVLEVGVGAGNILEKIPAAKKVGVDLSEFLLQKARARLGKDAELILGDAETLEKYIPSHSVDRAYCSEVLEHVRSPDAVLAGMATALTPDGIAVVSVPNEGFINRVKSWLKAIGIFRVLFPNMADHMEDEWHVHEFGRELLTGYCSKYFAIERIDAVPFPFLPIRLVAKLRPKIGVQHLPELLMTSANAVASPAQLKTDYSIKHFFKRWPSLYNMLFAVVGPSLLTGETSARFVDALPADAIVLHAGSGPRVLRRNCINVDLYPLPGVDVVADLAHLPFRDSSVDAVTCEQVLEHVEQPHIVAAELLRVTKSGGLLHIASPFVFPWHPSPSDFSRWTQQGLRSLFPGTIVVREGVMAGPFSALNALLPAVLAIIFCFGSRRLQSALQYAFLVLCMPIKLLDVVFAHIPGAELCAANFYLVVRKP